MRTPLLVTLARAVAIGAIGTIGTFSLAAVLAPVHAAESGTGAASGSDSTSGAERRSSGFPDLFEAVLPHSPHEPSPPASHPVTPWVAEPAPAPSCALPMANAVGRFAAMQA